jgi:hypothetical protein
MSSAWIAEVRAPVSILALMRSMPKPGRPIHSRQPMTGSGARVSRRSVQRLQ